MKRRGNVISPIDSVNTLVEQLQQTDSSVEDGETCWVRSTQELYVYRVNSGLIPDGINVVASLYGNGVWQKLNLGPASSETLNIPTVVGASASLKSVTPTAAVGAIVDGYYVEGDGGGGLFCWNAASAAVDNGGTVINPTAHVGNGRWIRVFSGALNVQWFGAVGDDTAIENTAIDSAIAVLTAAGGGTLVVPEGKTFKLNDVLTTIPSKTTVTGGGALHQTISGKAIFVATGTDNTKFSELSFSGPGGTARAPGNEYIYLTSCTHAVVNDINVTDSLWYPIRLDSCSRSQISDVQIVGAPGAIFLRGNNKIQISNCSADSPNTPAALFLTVFYLDSTDGHALGLNTDISLSGIQVSNFPNNQSIEVHGGSRIAIDNCVFDLVLNGVSLNPFNASDTLSDVSVTNMVYRGTATPGAISASNAGLVIGGLPLPGGPLIENVTISDVVIRDGNVLLGAAGSGGVFLANCKGVTVNGLVCDGCAHSGISMGPGVDDLIVNGYVAKNTVLANGRRAAILVNVAGSTNARFSAVTVDGAANVVRFDAVTPNFIFEDVTWTNVAAPVAYAGVGDNGVFMGNKLYTAADTTPNVNRSRYMRVANAAPTTISNFLNGIDGQEIVLEFPDANTTINRSNASLAGSVNFVSAAGASLRLAFSTADNLWHETSRVAASG